MVHMATRPGGGFSLGSPFGIPVRVGGSTGLLLMLAAVFASQQANAYFSGGVKPPAPVFVFGVAFAVLLFGSLLLHELCHCFAARSSGLPVIGIRFEGVGGASEFGRAASRAGQEAWIAVAGPLANLAIAGVTYIAMRSFHHGSTGWLFAAQLYYANIGLAVFNLLPGLPLDGGRVVAAGFWRVRGNRAAGIRAAARSGMLLAGALLVLGVRQFSTQSGFGLWTIVIAAAVFGGARQSLAAASFTDALPQLRAIDLARQPIFVTSDVPLAEALRRAEEAGARAVVTVDGDGKPVGVMTGAFVDAVPGERRPWVSVGSVSRTLSPETVLSSDLVGQDLIDQLRSSAAGEYLLVDAGGDIVGVLSTVDLVARLQALTS